MSKACAAIPRRIQWFDRTTKSGSGQKNCPDRKILGPGRGLGIVEETLCKLSYQFRASLGTDDQTQLTARHGFDFCPSAKQDDLFDKATPTRGPATTRTEVGWPLCGGQCKLAALWTNHLPRPRRSPSLSASSGLETSLAVSFVGIRGGLFCNLRVLRSPWPDRVLCDKCNLHHHLSSSGQSFSHI